MTNDLKVAPVAAAVTLALELSTPAQAGVITLDFEGVNGGYPSDSTSIVLYFYNGGTSSGGTTGPNFGVEFSANALGHCLNSATVT